MAQLWASKWLHLMLIQLWEHFKRTARIVYWKTAFLVQIDTRCEVNSEWTQSDEELQSFHSRTNNLHPSIKFTHEIYNTAISLLDTSSSLSKGDICNTRHRIPVKSPENSTTYFIVLIARVKLLFTLVSVQCVVSNTLASLSSPSTNAWMVTGVTLQTSHFFMWASTSDCLTTDSRISTKWKFLSLNRTVWGVIFNVRIGKGFGLKNSVFHIRTVLTENNRFLCKFSFTVLIVNEYFTTVTKFKICAQQL